MDIYWNNITSIYEDKNIMYKTQLGLIGCLNKKQKPTRPNLY